MSKAMRPRITPMVLFYALFDVAGMLVFSSGAVWLAKGQQLFLGDFPSSTAEAVLVCLAGAALMLWAAARILRELLKQPARQPPENG